MFKKRNEPETESNFIDLEAGVEGNLKFSSPIKLRINGKFEGELESKGVLIIGEKAEVKVTKIKGEDITIAGKVEGDIISSKRLELSALAQVIGNIKTPILIISEGAVLKGDCQMSIFDEKIQPRKILKRKKK